MLRLALIANSAVMKIVLTPTIKIKKTVVLWIAMANVRYVLTTVTGVTMSMSIIFITDNSCKRPKLITICMRNIIFKKTAQRRMNSFYSKSFNSTLKGQ